MCALNVQRCVDGSNAVSVHANARPQDDVAGAGVASAGMRSECGKPSLMPSWSVRNLFVMVDSLDCPVGSDSRNSDIVEALVECNSWNAIVVLQTTYGDVCVKSECSVSRHVLSCEVDSPETHTELRLLQAQDPGLAFDLC